MPTKGKKIYFLKKKRNVRMKHVVNQLTKYNSFKKVFYHNKSGQK